MKRWATGVLLSILGTGVGRDGQAEEFYLIGPRAMGMGGAGVATTRGALSTYWNPAALAPPRTPRVDTFFDLGIGASAGGTATNDVVAQIDALIDLADGIDFNDLENSLDSGNELSDADLRNVLALINSIENLDAAGTGLVANVEAGLNLRFGRLGISGLGIFNAGGLTNVDTTLLTLGNNGIDGIVGSGSNVPATPEGQALANSIASDLASQGVADSQRIANELVFQAEASGADVADPGFQGLLDDVIQATNDAQGNPVGTDEFFSGNQSGLDLRGIMLQEYAVGYAHPFFDLVSVGAAAKFLYATTYFNPFTLGNLNDFGDVLNEIKNDSLKEEDINFGLDVGALVTPTDWIAVGIVGKYLNRPEFDLEGPGDYTIDPQARAGVALGPFAGLTLAADVDLTSNETDAFPGYQSQLVGGGVEYNLNEWDILFLRGGVSKNVGEADESVVIHAGLGARVFGVALDLAGMLAPEFTDINTSADGSSDEIPERVGLAVMLSFNVPLD